MKGGQIPIFIVLFLSFSCVTLTKSERLDSHNVQRYLSALTQISGGGMEGFDLQRAAEFVVGKDRELIHASIDLKWLFDKVANRLTWIRVFESVVDRLRRIHPGYNAEVVYREQAHQIASDIYNIDPNSYNLRSALSVAQLCQRYSNCTVFVWCTGYFNIPSTLHSLWLWGRVGPSCCTAKKRVMTSFHLCPLF